MYMLSDLVRIDLLTVVQVLPVATLYTVSAPAIADLLFVAAPLRRKNCRHEICPCIQLV